MGRGWLTMDWKKRIHKSKAEVKKSWEKAKTKWDQLQDPDERCKLTVDLLMKILFPFA